MRERRTRAQLTVAESQFDDDSGSVTLVPHDADAPRYLARGAGYSTHPTGVDRLECIRPDEQARMSAAAREGERRRRLEAARTARKHVGKALDDFVEQSGSLPPKLRSSTRAVRRSVDALVRNAESAH